MRFLVRVSDTLTLILFFGWSIGQTFIDRTWITGLAFYIPSPIVFGLMTISIVQCWYRKARRQAAFRVVLALPVLAVMLGPENHIIGRHRQPESSAKDRTVVHWNTCSGHLGTSHVLRKLAEQNADFYLLSEQPSAIWEWIRTHEMSEKALGRMVAMAAGQQDVRVEEQWLVKTGDVEVCLLTWTELGETTTLFAVDLTSAIERHRDPLLQQINDLIRQHQPDIVIGDFNAPRRSYRLRHLPDGYRHAYDVAGHGLGYTWPVPLPVYAIDQCIVGPNVEVVSYDLESSYSDHRLQRLTFRKRTP